MNDEIAKKWQTCATTLSRREFAQLLIYRGTLREAEKRVKASMDALLKAAESDGLTEIDVTRMINFWENYLSELKHKRENKND